MDEVEPAPNLAPPLMPSNNSEIITSFANPNYTLNHSDALNSNFFPPDTGCGDGGSTTSSLFDELADSLSLQRGYEADSQSMQNYFDPFVQSSVGEGGEKDDESDVWHSPADSEGHFSMDSTATTPAERAESIIAVQHSQSIDSDMAGGVQEEENGRSGFTGFYTSVSPIVGEKRRQMKMSNAKAAQGGTAVAEKPKPKALEELARQQGHNDAASPSADSQDSGIQADVTSSTQPLGSHGDNNSKTSQDDSSTAELPIGWQQCTDEEGPYYWHVKSGTIQRQPPTPGDTADLQHSQVMSAIQDDILSPGSNNVPSFTPKDKDNSCVSLQASQAAEHVDSTHAVPNLVTPPLGIVTPIPREVKEPVPSLRYAVRSLGWVPIAEDDLTQERSSRAVNKCIVDLSLGRNDINDGVGRWGDGKDLYLDLDQDNLSLLDTVDLSVLNVQPVQSIRVWGVGRDNGRERDFAYVARDRASKRYMCHVFRCDTPARHIANNLRDICQRIVVERNLHPPHGGKNAKSCQANRPKNLPNLEKSSETSQETLQRLLQMTSFPTPMEEPKKIIQCHYLGTLTVVRPTGIEVLNSAVEKLYSSVPPEEWNFVNVAVAPSTITVSEHGNEENVLAECRVRFLSFMGIAQRNVKLCSFIMHTAQDQFLAHVFHSEPSAGALCKTIEAACKLRYQKCLDAHQKQMLAAGHSDDVSTHSKASGITLTSIRSGFQNMFSRLSKKSQPASQT